MGRYTDITVREADFDFSKYHALEHSIWACHDRASHARLWWSYVGEEAIAGAIVGTFWRTFLCRFGKHWMLPTLDLEGHIFGTVCSWCPVAA